MTRIRPIAPGDAAAVDALLVQLGYPPEANAVPARLARMAQEGLTVVIVADTGGLVTGLATGHMVAAIHTDVPVAYITALVVDEGHRGRGIGRALCAHVEEWARRHGATRLSVVTGLPRDDAHRFYERIGYTHTARRYSKMLVS